MPDWIVKLWISEEGTDEAEQLCVASNDAASATLRANTCRIRPEILLAELLTKGYQVCKATVIPEEITLREGSLPLRSKWFREGLCMMQDPAAMLGAHLLEPMGGERILDMCAAPGGKTTHIAERTRCAATIIAGDSNISRVKLILENIKRLQESNICIYCGDGTVAPFRCASFDRIIVDAPCSGLGTLRRHPDIKWRLQPSDIERCAAKQRELLRSAISLCKNGGIIVYGVCTFTRAETEGVIDSILETKQVLLEDGPEWLNRWKIGRGKYRTKPQRDNMDGFFWTRLRKQS